MRFLRFVSLAAIVLVLGSAPAQADPVTGDIAVYNASNTLIGYVSATYDSQNSFTFTSNIANALQVEINTPVSAPFSMLEVNPPGPNHYFGAVGGSGGYYLGAGQGGYTYLSGSALTAAGSTPASVATDLNSLGYHGPAESTIWSVDSNNVISAQWVNSDSTVDTATMFYDPVVDYLGLTGDLSLYNSNYGDGAYLVHFVFTGDLPAPVPEPGSFALAATGFVGLITVRLLRRRGHRKAG